MIIERIPEWSLGPSDDSEIADLLARCFGTDFGGRSFFQTRHHLRLVHRRGPIVAHMAVQFRAMRLGERLITIAGLADVATDPEMRGQGLASELLQSALQIAETSSADHVLLFGEAKLYSAVGFVAVQNPVIRVEMRGAATGAVLRGPSQGLMMLTLRNTEWDETATLDLLGNSF